MNIKKYIDEMKEVQENLLEFLDNDANNETTFQNSRICDDQNKLKTLLHLILNIANNHQRKQNFFSKIDQVLMFYKEYIKKYFSNWEIFNIFKRNKRILLFLIDEQIMFMDERIAEKFLTDVKLSNTNYPDYFAPEIKPFISDYLQYKEEDVIERINEIPENFYDLRKLGENGSYICQLIQNDLINEFILYVNQNNLSIDSTIERSIYETNSFLINMNHIKLIEYAAFYGSIKIFKYLYSNKAKLNRLSLHFAIHGRNPEIIHILEENIIENIKNPYEYYFIESIKCHHNEIADYFLNNYLQNDDNYTNYIIDAFLKNYNFSFIQDKYINGSTFNSLIRYDYYMLVDTLLKSQNIDINELTIYRKKVIVNDEKIYYSALHFASKKNNIEIVRLLLSNHSINVNIRNNNNETPLFIAIENNNIEVVQLLLSNPNININAILKTY